MEEPPHNKFNPDKSITTHHRTSLITAIMLPAPDSNQQIISRPNNEAIHRPPRRTSRSSRRLSIHGIYKAFESLL